MTRTAPPITSIDGVRAEHGAGTLRSSTSNEGSLGTNQSSILDRHPTPCKYACMGQQSSYFAFRALRLTYYGDQHPILDLANTGEWQKNAKRLSLAGVGQGRDGCYGTGSFATSTCRATAIIGRGDKLSKFTGRLVGFATIKFFKIAQWLQEWESSTLEAGSLTSTPLNPRKPH